MDTIMYIAGAILCYYLIVVFAENKNKPLSKHDFLITCTIILVLFSVVTYCFRDIYVQNHGEYREYKYVNEYIHSLNDNQRKNFQKVLISQKANIEKKYGLEYSPEKYDLVEAITNKNSDRFGMYVNPMRVEEYFNDDQYYIVDHFYYAAGIVYVIIIYLVYCRRIHS